MIVGTVVLLAFATRAQATIPAGNLTANPSFETNLTGWQAAANATTARVGETSPPDGSWAIQVSSTAGNTSGYGIDDDGYTVGSTQAGFVYTAGASFKAPSAAMASPAP